MEKWLTPRTTVFLVGALTLWRLYLSATLQLHPDEAYYWLWSRNLDISYFDHPPMVAVFIWLTTLFSQTEVWVRLSGQLVFVLASGLLWRLAWQWSGSVAVAAGSVILLNVYPLTMLGLTVMTPDVPVFLFWALGVSLFWQILRSGQAWLWYTLGGAFGLGRGPRTGCNGWRFAVPEFAHATEARPCDQSHAQSVCYVFDSFRGMFD